MLDDMAEYSWYVLTGGPSSGKTTVLERLRQLGYAVVPEASTRLIEEHHAKGIPVKELRKDKTNFERRILQMKIEDEEKAPKDRIVFFDRAMPDSIAYFELAGMDPKEAGSACRNRYLRIFFFEQLPFVKGHTRIEDEFTVKQLNSMIFKAYEGLGYKIMRVPLMSTEERVRFILSNL